MGKVTPGNAQSTHRVDMIDALNDACRKDISAKKRVDKAAALARNHSEFFQEQMDILMNTTYATVSHGVNRGEVLEAAGKRVTLESLLKNDSFRNMLDRQPFDRDQTIAVAQEALKDALVCPRLNGEVKIPDKDFDEFFKSQGIEVQQAKGQEAHRDRLGTVAHAQLDHSPRRPSPDTSRAASPNAVSDGTEYGTIVHDPHQRAEMLAKAAKLGAQAIGTRTEAEQTRPAHMASKPKVENAGLDLSEADKKTAERIVSSYWQKSKAELDIKKDDLSANQIAQIAQTSLQKYRNMKKAAKAFTTEHIVGTFLLDPELHNKKPGQQAAPPPIKRGDTKKANPSVSEEDRMMTVGKTHRDAAARMQAGLTDTSGRSNPTLRADTRTRPQTTTRTQTGGRDFN